MKQKVGVGLLGYGTVGSGVFHILTAKATKLMRTSGIPIEVIKVAEKYPERLKGEVPDELVTTDVYEVINNPDIDVVVEVIGGLEPAHTFIKAALEAKKHVVTANKAVMATYGGELLELAEAQGVDLYFEASVGGGIPIITPMKHSLAANKITRVMGIVNGTTNYILTKMTEEDMSLEDALKEAQAKGFAEADPTADVEGHDAAAKIAILASIAFNSRVTIDDVYKEGIMKVTKEDIAYAKTLGYTIKLLAIAKEDEDGMIEVRVHPAMISLKHPLANVSGVMNAIFVEGDAVGEVMFYGPGAGSLPAASAVVGDVFEIALGMRLHKVGSMACTCYEHKPIKPIEEITSRYYMRLGALDKPGVFAKVAQAFGNNEVNIESAIQENTYDGYAELVFGMYQVKEQNMRNAIEEIKKLDVVASIGNILRVEG
ncbi:MAG TPA: homoserine dehydrogenase [Candidatus Aquicultor sp.]|jgi:homoserine dehydrogenase